MKVIWAWTLLAVIALRRLPLVLTLHNLEPHGGPRSTIEQRFIALLKGRASAVVTLVPEHEELITSKNDYRNPVVRTIPLGGLSRVTSQRRAKFRDGPLNLFHLGVIAPYKGQRLVARGLSPYLERGEVRLVIAGRADEDYLQALERQTSPYPNVTIKSGWLDDAELERHLTDADAVIGYQNSGLNTGTIYSSVPAGVPVVCSPTAQAKSEASRIGTDWVLIIEDVEDADAWATIIDRLREFRSVPARPPSADFDWESSGHEHARLYEELLRPAGVAGHSSRPPS